MKNASKKTSYSAPWEAYWELTKPRIIFMVLGVIISIALTVGSLALTSY